MNLNKLVHSTPTYEDIFGNPPDSRHRKLDALPSDLALPFLAMLTSTMRGQLSLDPIDELRVLHDLLHPSNPRELRHIKNHLTRVRESGRTISLFNRKTCLLLMAKILREGRPMQDSPEDTSGIELLKFYLAFESEVSDQDLPVVMKALKASPVDPNHFYEYTWPMFLKTHWLSKSHDPVLGLLKVVYALDHLMKSPEYSSCVDRYLRIMQSENLWAFFAKLADVLNHLGKLLPLKVPFIVQSDAYTPILDIWSRCSDEIGKSAIEIGLEAIYTKPLIKFRGSSYLVLDPEILCQGIYDSILRHFYSVSGISNVKPMARFIDLKKHVGEVSLEEKVLRRIVEYIFSSRYDTIKYPKSKDNAYPDAIAIHGSDTFLFEHKDVSLRYSSIEERSFDAVYKDVQEKLIQDPKKPNRGGAVQLARYAKDISTTASIRLDRTYPILVFTDSMYTLPGVSELVNREFKRISSGLDIQDTRPLIMISLDYLFFNAYHIKRIGLKACISKQQSKLKKAVKKAERTKELEDAFRANEPFEYGLGYLGKSSYRMDKRFMRHMLKGIIPE